MKKIIIVLLMLISIGLPATAQKQSKTISNDDLDLPKSPAARELSLDCQAISRADKASAVLFDGAVLQPDNIGLRVTGNSITTKQLNPERYQSTSLREIVNEAKTPLSIWLFSPILGNEPSEYQVLLNGKEVKWKLFNSEQEWHKCIGHKITATFPDRPNLFAQLGELKPDEKLRVEVIYQAAGFLTHR